VRRLLDVPGLGVVRAAQIVAAVITPHRFRAREQFWSYCGLAIITRSSSDWIPKGARMVRSHRALPRGLAPGNRTLKCAFKGAALDVVRHYPKHPWAVAGQRPNLSHSLAKSQKPCCTSGNTRRSTTRANTKFQPRPNCRDVLATACRGAHEAADVAVQSFRGSASTVILAALVEQGPCLRLRALGAPTETLVLRDPARRMVPPLFREHIQVCVPRHHGRFTRHDTPRYTSRPATLPPRLHGSARKGRIYP
jgi:hypothetical protein